MVAVNVPNTRLKPYRKAIDNGQILFCIDVPATQVDAVSELVGRHYPEAGMHEIEPTIPAFP
jgi:hypothetical protein